MVVTFSIMENCKNIDFMPKNLYTINAVTDKIAADRTAECEET